MGASNNAATDEAAIRELVENWARAVRAKDFNGILANHSADMLMFDLPPPLESKGIEAYRKTWDLFFSWSDDPVVFAFNDMHITTGNDVAFVAALMRSVKVSDSFARRISYTDHHLSCRTQVQGWLPPSTTGRYREI
jgi:ketosteroid isomerase-like protein